MAVLSTPTGLQLAITEQNNLNYTVTFSWNINTTGHPGPYNTETEYEVNGGGTWVPLDSAPGIITQSVLTPCEYNWGYKFRVRWYCAHCESYSNWATTGSIIAYNDSTPDSVGFSDEVTEYVDHEGSGLTATGLSVVGWGDSATSGIAAADSESSTVTWSDLVFAGSTIKTAYAYYLGSAGGNVYKYNGDYKADGTAAIPCYIRTKKLDFADTYPQYAAWWKQLHTVILNYVDKGAHFITVRASNDGGVTWDVLGKTIGNGSETTKTTWFSWNKSGQFFNIEIVHSSTDANFQWIGLELEFSTLGEAFETP